ncbi:MAG: glycosyltransferase family 2 protein [Spirochaetales bacterium]|nr:glycosyltransferase family 2 protein [Spirochaetales bacterium]
MKALVVIPARNESASIAEVVERALQYADVSVTDDGSTDDMPRILEGLAEKSARGLYAHRLHVIRHERSTHIPRAVQDGLCYGVEQGYDSFITMDAGLSHDPDAIPLFLQEDPGYDVIIGSRKKVAGVPLYRRVISRLAALVVNYALSASWTGIRRPFLRDVTSGFRRYSARAAQILCSSALASRAFDFHMEALALSLRQGCRCKEIPIEYVFTGSSFNMKVLRLGISFGWQLIRSKGATS